MKLFKFAPVAKVGDIRITTKFALLPKIMSDRTVIFFEEYVIHQKYVFEHIADPKGGGWFTSGWKTIKKERINKYLYPPVR